MAVLVRLDNLLVMRVGPPPQEFDVDHGLVRHSPTLHYDLRDANTSPLSISLTDFVWEFGDELLETLNRANPPVWLTAVPTTGVA